MRITRWVTEWLLPSLLCPCCGKVTTADAPPGAHPGTISYGPGINGAAVLLSGYGNVPSERAARLIAMLLGMPVSPGFVDRASARLDEKLQAAGFDDAMQAALADEPVLGADETPVNVLARGTDPQTGEPAEGAPHVLIVRPPGGKLTLSALRSGDGPWPADTKCLSHFAQVVVRLMIPPGQPVHLRLRDGRGIQVGMRRRGRLVPESVAHIHLRTWRQLRAEVAR